MNNKKIFPCIWQAAVLLLVSFSVMVVVSLFIGIIHAIAKYAEIPLLIAAMPYLEGVVNLVLIPISVGVIVFSKSSFKDVFSLKGTRIVLLIPLTITVIGSSIIESEVENLFRYFVPMPEFILELMMGLFSDPIVSFLLLVVIASLTEELLFRGVILRAFLTHYSKPKSILISAVFFSLFHINPYQLFSAFIAGLLLGWIYTETRSLYLCMFAHSFHNLIGWLVYYRIFNVEIPGFSGGDMDLSTVSFQPWWFDLSGFIILIAGIFVLHLLFKSNREPVADKIV